MSYLARELGVRTLIDSTTLTDTNAFTAYKHGAVMASDQQLEHLCVTAGLQSGEHLLPMAWLPEDFESALFSSPVADMVNRSSSMGLWSALGGYFIFAQVEDVPGVRWAHIDLGDPVVENFGTGFGVPGRCTGFSVELLATVVRNVMADDAVRQGRGGSNCSRL